MSVGPSLWLVKLALNVNKGVTKAVYSDRHKYPASIIAKIDDKTVFQEMQQNIFLNKPRVLCKKLYSANAKISTIKNCDNEKVANTCIPNDIDKLRTFIDKNEGDKAEMEKENCNYQKTDPSKSSDFITTFIDKNKEDNTAETEKTCHYQETTDLSKSSDIIMTFFDENRGDNRAKTEKTCHYRETTDLSKSSDIIMTFFDENGNNLNEVQNEDCDINRVTDIVVSPDINTPINFNNENVSIEMIDMPCEYHQGDVEIDFLEDDNNSDTNTSLTGTLMSFSLLMSAICFSLRISVMFSHF